MVARLQTQTWSLEDASKVIYSIVIRTQHILEAPQKSEEQLPRIITDGVVETFIFRKVWKFLPQEASAWKQCVGTK